MTEQNSKPRGYWTKEKVRTGILERVEKGLAVSPTAVGRSDQSLYQAGLRMYKSWQEALEDAGIDWEHNYKRKPTGYWTRARVREAVENRINNNLPITHKELRGNHGGLYYAINQQYGGVGKLLEELGLDVLDYVTQKPHGYWTKATVIEELAKRKAQGKSLHTKVLREEDGPLDRNIRELFDSWEEAYKEIGEDVNNYRTRGAYRRWTGETVVTEMVKRKEQGKSLNAGGVDGDDSPLYINGLRYYGSWDVVLEVLGRTVKQEDEMNGEQAEASRLLDGR